MTKREHPVELILTVGVDDTITIQDKNGDKGYGWGPGTALSEEVIEMLEEQEMI